MDRKLFLNVITIIINCILIISSYFLIKEMNIYTVHYLLSVFVSFSREITRFRCVYLISRHSNAVSRHSLNNYYYLLLFFKIVNVFNIFLLITNDKQYIYVDNRLLIIYYLYEIFCIFVIPKINVERISNNIPLREITRNNIKIIKISLKELDYYNIEQCYICCDRKGNNTILNCNHNMICDVCIKKIDKCPICRGNITEILELSQE